MPQPATHPSRSELSNFNLGTLSPDAAAAIESHIAGCTPCCETLMEISGDDTFVHMLREVSQDDHQATVDIAPTSGPSAEREDIPPALASHDRYQVVELVGRGGMGDVYKAEHSLMQADRCVEGHQSRSGQQAGGCCAFSARKCAPPPD